MRLLIPGATGLLGSNLVRRASHHTTVGTYRDPSARDSAGDESIRFDALSDSPHELLAQADVDAVINCIAFTDVDAAEEDDTARRLNAEFPGRLAEAARERGVRLVHISTDSVFGAEGTAPYGEDDAPAPVNAYAESKLQGERNVLAANPDALVARVNFVTWSSDGRGLAEWALRTLQSGEVVPGFGDVHFNPLTGPALADFLIGFAAREDRGVVHLGCSGSLSKYEFIVGLARRLGYPDEQVAETSIEDVDFVAARPHDTVLDVSQLRTIWGDRVPKASQMLDALIAERESWNDTN